MTSAARTRDLDVVVHGATGFVGRLTAAYLAAHAPAGARIGLSGRSQDKLEAVRATLGTPAAAWPLIVADATDHEALAALAARTHVVASTVGPYARYGMPLVQACAEAGTDYTDLTGEVLFVRESIDAWHATAEATGARIVHACGFDSIPSELGALLLHEQIAEDGAGTMTETVLVLASAKGGFSGGTLDSLRNQVDVVSADKSQAAVVADLYALSPDRAAEPDRTTTGWAAEGDQRTPRREPMIDGAWTAPFVMEGYNSRIVRRSAALLERAYGDGFRYRETMAVGSSPVAPLIAGGITVGLGALAAAMSFSPLRPILDRVMPSPGEGPSEKARENGHFRTRTHTRTTTGAHYVATIAAQGDPGYKATAVMLAEASLALALDADTLPDAAGVLTPATAIGSRLAQRLRDAGFTLEVARR